MKHQIHQDLKDVHVQNESVINLLLKLEGSGFDSECLASVRQMHYMMEAQFRNTSGGAAEQHVLQSGRHSSIVP